MRHSLTTEIEIEAPPEVVWGVLIDLDSYEDWNPFISESAGEVVVGERLTNRMTPPDGKAVRFRPTVTEVDEAHTFEWFGRLGVPGVFDGRHRFELAKTATGTRVVHSEQLNGILVRPMRRSLDSKTMAGFIAMNEALRDRAEAMVRADDSSVAS